MDLLSQEQKDIFWRDGVLVLENAASPQQLAALKEEFCRLGRSKPC
jgi:phytanoyl-CoA hydroxylase